jgi:hypothetical protein
MVGSVFGRGDTQRPNVNSLPSIQQKVEAMLEGVQSGKDANMKLGPEGGDRSYHTQDPLPRKLHFSYFGGGVHAK